MSPLQQFHLSETLFRRKYSRNWLPMLSIVAILGSVLVAFPWTLGWIITTVEFSLIFATFSLLLFVPIYFLIPRKSRWSVRRQFLAAFIGWSMGLSLCCVWCWHAHSYTEVIPVSQRSAGIRSSDQYWETVTVGQELLVARDLLERGLDFAICGLFIATFAVEVWDRRRQRVTNGFDLISSEQIRRLKGSQ